MGDAEAVRFFLLQGGAVDGAENDGWTPLHFAAANNNIVLVQMLLGAGADPHLRAMGGGEGGG
ncbi:hypothetical protein B484DRAFT_390977, partial [Ochromonadaceae sp. CCMP2298]